MEDFPRRETKWPTNTRRIFHKLTLCCKAALQYCHTPTSPTPTSSADAHGKVEMMGISELNGVANFI
jgi:hypothetical protein